MHSLVLYYIFEQQHFCERSFINDHGNVYFVPYDGRKNAVTLNLKNRKINNENNANV